jgi:hypothetical protein
MTPSPTIGFIALLATIPVSFLAGYHAGVRTTLDDVDLEEAEP